MCEAGAAVVERDPAVKSLVELDFSSGKAKAPVLREDLSWAPLGMSSSGAYPSRL